MWKSLGLSAMALSILLLTPRKSQAQESGNLVDCIKANLEYLTNKTSDNCIVKVTIENVSKWPIDINLTEFQNRLDFLPTASDAIDVGKLGIRKAAIEQNFFPEEINPHSTLVKTIAIPYIDLSKIATFRLLTIAWFKVPYERPEDVIPSKFLMIGRVEKPTIF